ncbi:hypothetical protein [Thiolapillus sp.]|uniref:hypothetical protein n=2 Tax=Thiolapillus sp. TaxID=2017437 RepID=UPI003AF8AEE7
MAVLGIPVNIMTSIIPALLIIIGSTEDIHLRCQPWRAKRRLVDPSSREAALLTRRAHSARGEAK